MSLERCAEWERPIVKLPSVLLLKGHLKNCKLTTMYLGNGSNETAKEVSQTNRAHSKVFKMSIGEDGNYGWHFRVEKRADVIKELEKIVSDFESDECKLFPNDRWIGSAHYMPSPSKVKKSRDTRHYKVRDHHSACTAALF